jgi:hypothetical protein
MAARPVGPNRPQRTSISANASNDNYRPGIPQLTERNSLFVQAFSECFAKFMPTARGDECVAALCIAWHHLCIVSPLSPEAGAVAQNLVTRGAEQLAAT